MSSPADMRQHYDKLELLEQDATACPFELFDRWFKEAAITTSTEGEANAMTLATVNAEQQPEARMVLLKEYSDEGFVFFTNYHSDKGDAIAHNPRVCLLFYWSAQQRQVRIDGVASKLSEDDSTAYFNIRPYGSRIGAWASQQSQVTSREELARRYQHYIDSYPDEVLKPPHWGGYLVRPTRIEFWQGRPSRMHDRLCYQKQGDNWSMSRLAP